MKNNYWADRVAKAQTAITQKNIKQIQKQMRKYYKHAMEYIIDDFIATYEKIQKAAGEDKQPTPADLYKLDKYWQMVGQMRQELRKLGDKRIIQLSKIFEVNYFEIYHSINIEGKKAFSTLDTEGVQQMINSVWVADGKSWSSRVWEDTEKLAETLNEELIQCVAAGKTTSQLKEKLQERFSVSFNNADMIARTELAHIQTEAAKKRYEDYGLKQVQIWADEDERRCEVCGKLHEKLYPIGAQVPIPAHPRCRCCVIPYIED